ncbi:MAG: hypothetical protein ACP5I6_07295 [Caldisphaera sp.]|jgi:hypothetical protein|nr:hypothetical protein [Caldisphaera sp.]PMP87959.1 MAG: hypothetical protein C0172_03675 [Caldisphaera sp.]
MEYDNVIDIEFKPTNDITISTKISPYELNLINKISEQCGISKSSFIRLSIKLALYYIFSNNTEIFGEEWGKIVENYKLNFDNVMKKCDEKTQKIKQWR